MNRSSTNVALPSRAEIESACAELLWFQQASLIRIADMARPFLAVEAEFVSELRIQFRKHIGCLPDDELDDMANAVMTLARCGVGSGTWQ